MYQVGVLVSRSSGMLWKANMKALWIMPSLQVVLLIFFVLDAYYQWWYDWSLLCLCFVVGIFGGAVRGIFGVFLYVYLCVYLCVYL